MVGMTMAEVDDARAKNLDSPVMTITVHDHKGLKPARLMAGRHVQGQLLLWIQHLRPKYAPADSQWVVSGTDWGKVDQRVAKA